jgi:hypothetical protein
MDEEAAHREPLFEDYPGGNPRIVSGQQFSF